MAPASFFDHRPKPCLSSSPTVSPTLPSWLDSLAGVVVMRLTASASSVTTTSGDGLDNDKLPLKTLSASLWATSTLLWSIFTPPHRTFAARVLLVQPAWAIRIYVGDATWLQDLLLFLSTHAVYSYYTGAWRLPQRHDFEFLDPNNNTMHLYYQVFPLLAACGLFASGIVFRGHHLDFRQMGEPPRAESIDEQVLPPLLLPSRTTHTRLFPQKHAFTYSYLLVGVPIGIEGRISRILSVDSAQNGWFAVNAADYLHRGRNGMKLAAKLRSYMHSQGVSDREYAFAYLVTAPRFLGYSFNPVSFWYLYDGETRLKYMILEVNNTFDERRMYLLRAEKDKPAMNGTGAANTEMHPNGSTDTSHQVVFSEIFEKDFHVSPFNSRKGSYSLRAKDPLSAFEETGRVQIDNTIVLRSSKEHAKIVARVCSVGEAKDPAKLSTWDTVIFIAAWCWVGFATFPRILFEAGRLFFQRKLHVWYKPEVTKSSVGRTYTSDEEQLEPFFRAFLTDCVNNSAQPLRVIYEPAHREGEEVVIYSPNFTYKEDQRRTLTLKVLSPAFYSRFVHYTSAKQAFESECLDGEEKNRTAAVDQPDLLDTLLQSIEETWGQDKKDQRRSYMIEQIRWACMRRLRCPPPTQPYAAKAIMTPSTSSRNPEIDAFVQLECEDSPIYRRVVTKLFLAQRIAFGTPSLVDAGDLVLRIGLLLASMIYCDQCTVLDIFRPRALEPGDYTTALTMFLLANGIHIWSLVKG